MQTYLNVKQLAERHGVNPSTIWRRLQKNPTFPKPHKFGPQTLRWNTAELEAWEEAQKVPS